MTLTMRSTTLHWTSSGRLKPPSAVSVWSRRGRSGEERPNGTAVNSGAAPPPAPGPARSPAGAPDRRSPAPAGTAGDDPRLPEDGRVHRGRGPPRPGPGAAGRNARRGLVQRYADAGKPGTRRGAARSTALVGAVVRGVTRTIAMGGERAPEVRGSLHPWPA